MILFKFGDQHWVIEKSHMEILKRKKNIDAWKAVKVPLVNVNRLKNLQQLEEHGVHIQSFRPIVNHPACTDIIQLYSILLDDEIAGIGLIQQIFVEKKCVMNIHLYYTILEYLHEYGEYKNASTYDFINHYLSNYDKILNQMIRLHIKECKQGLKYVRHRKLKHLNLEISDKHGKQWLSESFAKSIHQCKRASKKWCCFCARQVLLAVLIARRDAIWTGFGSCGYIHNHNSWNCFEGVHRNINPCPLHKEVSSIALEQDYRFTVGLYNHCALRSNPKGLHDLFMSINKITDTWLIHGEFGKIYQIGVKFFRALFDEKLLLKYC